MRALEYYEETIVIGIRSDESKLVGQSLQSMYSEFPHLEKRVKARRATKTGLFGPSRKGSAGLWNEAREHYTRLRYLLNQPARFRFELGEVIRLSQWVIVADKNFGDAYVLLANAYSILDSHVTDSTSEPHKYLRWSASILQHWMETSLSQYPFAKNVANGHTLYNDILKQLSLVDDVSHHQLVLRIRQRYQNDLALALSPATFKQIKAQLEAQTL